jgi:AAA15 family ATPase/GTPase
MLIKSPTLQSFKSYGTVPVKIEFSKINLIYGRNSCGKSTIFQALRFFADVISNGSATVADFKKYLNHTAREKGDLRIRL